MNTSSWRRLRLWKRGGAAEAQVPDSAAPTPQALRAAATPKMALPLSGLGGVGPDVAGKVPPLPPAEAGQTPLAVPPGAPPPGPEAQAAAAPETAATKDPAADDLMSLFAEEDSVNEDLRRLATGLEEVDIQELGKECRQVAVQLRRRRQRVRL